MADRKKKDRTYDFSHDPKRWKAPKNFKEKIYKLIKQCILHPSTPLVLMRGVKTKKELPSYLPLFKDRSGLEIGGGTRLFSDKEFLPIYSLAQSVDGCNFSKNTEWEGEIRSNLYIYNNKNLGRQFIAEATDLISVINKDYDFIISSNCLEHIANPIKAIENWLLALRPGGQMMLIVPNKISNFDHRRKYTSFRHLIDDYQKNVKEDDSTHLNEILAFHDIDRDPGAVSRDFFLGRSKLNLKNRCLHHHVF